MKNLKALLRSNSGMTLLEVVASVLIIAMASAMIFMALMTGGNLIRRGSAADALGLEAFFGARDAEIVDGEPYSVSFTVDRDEIRGISGEIIETRAEDDSGEVNFKVFVPRGDGTP